MHVSKWLAAAGAAFVAMFATTAFADEAEYLALRTIEKIDDKCRVLMLTERGELAEELWDKDPNREAVQRGKMTWDEHRTWAESVSARAKKAADALDCSDQARPYLERARAIALARTTQVILLANHWAGTDPKDVYLPRRLYRPVEVSALQTFDRFIRQVWGPRFDRLLAEQRQVVSAMVPPKKIQASEAAPDPSASTASCVAYTLGCDIGGPPASKAPPKVSPDWKKGYDVQARVGEALARMIVDAAAQRMGLRATLEWEPSSGQVVTLIDPQTKAVRMTFFYPGVLISYKSSNGGAVEGAFALMADGAARLILLEPVQPAPSRIELAVRTGKAPDGVNPRLLPGHESWPKIATRYVLPPAMDACPGSACFSIPKQAMEAWLALPEGEDAQLYLTNGTDPAGKTYIGEGVNLSYIARKQLSGR